MFCGERSYFDTGGINLKPSDTILGMNMDMSGCSIAKLSLGRAYTKNIVALVPAVEICRLVSAIDERCAPLGGGKHRRVLNTDARGGLSSPDPSMK